MTNKIDSINIVREREHDHQNEVQPSSNADYVENLDKTSSIMPPQKPFEKEAAQDNSNVKEQDAQNKANGIVKNAKDIVYDIERSDKTTDTKLHLLSIQYEKLSMILGKGNMSAKDIAEIRTFLKLLEDKINLFSSKQRAGGGSPPRMKPKDFLDDIDISGMAPDLAVNFLAEQHAKIALLLKGGSLSEEDSQEKRGMLENLKSKMAIFGFAREEEEESETTDKEQEGKGK